MRPQPIQAPTSLPEAAAPAPVHIVQISKNTGIFSTFAKAVNSPELGSMLSGPGPYTVFVPNAGGEPSRLLANNAELARLLKYHLVAGRITAADMARGDSELTTLEGGKIKLRVGTEIHVNSVKVVQSHIDASYGVIHVIDDVLTPPRS